MVQYLNLGWTLVPTSQWMWTVLFLNTASAAGTTFVFLVLEEYLNGAENVGKVQAVGPMAEPLLLPQLDWLVEGKNLFQVQVQNYQIMVLI